MKALLREAMSQTLYDVRDPPENDDHIKQIESVSHFVRGVHNRLAVRGPRMVDIFKSAKMDEESKIRAREVRKHKMALRAHEVVSDAIDEYRKAKGNNAPESEIKKHLENIHQKFSRAMRHSNNADILINGLGDVTTPHGRLPFKSGNLPHPYDTDAFNIYWKSHFRSKR